MGDEQCAAGAHGDGLAVGVGAACGGVDEDDVEVGSGLREQLGEQGPGEQFLRVGRGGAGGEDGEVAQRGHALDQLGAAAAGERGGEAAAVVDAEQVVLARGAQVGVDDEGALTELREDDAEVGGEPRAAFAAAGADDGQRFALGIGVEPAQHELAAQCTQGFDLWREGVVGGDDFARDFALAGVEVGVVELAREGVLDIAVGNQAELLGGVAEAQALLLREAQDTLGVAGFELAGVDQDGADRAVVAGLVIGELFDHVVRAVHRETSPARAWPAGRE